MTTICNIVSYRRCVTDGIILVNLFCILSIRATSVFVIRIPSYHTVFQFRSDQGFVQSEQYLSMSVFDRSVCKTQYLRSFIVCMLALLRHFQVIGYH